MVEKTLGKHKSLTPKLDFTRGTSPPKKNKNKKNPPHCSNGNTIHIEGEFQELQMILSEDTSADVLGNINNS